MGETVLLWLIMGMLAVSGAEGGLGVSDGLRGAVGLGADCGGRTGGEKVWPGTSGAVSKDYDVQDGQGFGFDLPEGGGHQYYTEGRAKAAAGTVFDEKFAQKTTDALAEGAQHQYYTAGRATENFKANIAGTSVLTLKDVDQLVTKQKSYIIDAGRLG